MEEGGTREGGAVFAEARSRPGFRSALEDPHSRWPVLRRPLLVGGVGLVLLGFGVLYEPTGSRWVRRSVARSIFSALDDFLGRTGRGWLLGGPGGALAGLAAAGIAERLRRPRERRLVRVEKVWTGRWTQEAIVADEGGRSAEVDVTREARIRIVPGAVGVACFVGDVMTEFRPL